MGQKVNPIGFRLGINRTWESRWYAGSREYGVLLHEDLQIRRMVREHMVKGPSGRGEGGDGGRRGGRGSARRGSRDPAISRIVIERPHKKCRVIIHTARPGIIIGQGGESIELLRRKLARLTNAETHLDLVEVRRPETDARLVAENVAQQLEARSSFRRAMRRAVQNAMRMGVEGVRVTLAGRLGGVEIARVEWHREGRVPLHTLRADIDYAAVDARTAYGVCGVKVWIFKGEIMEHDPSARDRRINEMTERRPGQS